MKKLCTLLIALLAGICATPLVAEATYKYCNSRCRSSWDFCNGTFEIFGAPLYLRPSTCDLNFAIDNRNLSHPPINSGGTTLPLEATDEPAARNSLEPYILPKGVERGVCPDYEWGFRIGGSWILNCGSNDVRLFFQRLRTTDRDFISELKPGDGIWATIGHPRNLEHPFLALDNMEAHAHTKVHFEWDAVDGQLATRQLVGCNLWLRGFVGLHWSEICARREAYYQGHTKTMNSEQETTLYKQSRTWGIGPRIGVDLIYDLWCGFGIGGRGGAALLAGEARNRSHQIDKFYLAQPEQAETTTQYQEVEEVLEVGHRHRCIVVPYFDTSLGINYTYCGSCFSAFIELGYEFRSYVNALTQNSFNDFGATSSELCDSFNLDGIYLDIHVAF